MKERLPHQWIPVQFIPVKEGPHHYIPVSPSSHTRQTEEELGTHRSIRDREEGHIHGYTLKEN